MSSANRLAATLGALVGLSFLLQTHEISAQGRRAPPGAVRMELPALNAKGTVEGMVAPNVIKMVSDSTQTWFLRFSPETKIEITGKAKADMLVPGQYVSFVATVNQRTSRVEEKVGKLTLFAPSVKSQPGAIPEQEAAKGAFGNAAGAGVNGGAGPKPAPGFGQAATEPAARGGKAAGKARATASDSFEVKGRISSIKAGKVTLYVPNQYFKSTLKLDLTDDPEVSVEMEGTVAQCPMIARKGDKIEARGRQVAENGGDVLEMKIALTEPLTTDTQKKPRGKPATARNKKSEGSEDAATGRDDNAKGRHKAAAKDDPADEPGDGDEPLPKGNKGTPKKPAKSKERDDPPAEPRDAPTEDAK